MNIQGSFPLGWTGLISLLSKGLSRVFFSTTIRKRQSFNAQPSLWSNFHIRMTPGKTTALTIWTSGSWRSFLLQPTWFSLLKKKKNTPGAPPWQLEDWSPLMGPKLPCPGSVQPLPVPSQYSTASTDLFTAPKLLTAFSSSWSALILLLCL